MDFKVGDKVRIKKNLKEIDCFSCGYASDMRTYEGDIVTIRNVEKNYVQLKGIPFYWDKRAFEPIYTKLTKKELSDMPIGTKITTDKGEILVKDDEIHFENPSHILNISDINKDLTMTEYIAEYWGTKIVKIEVPTYSTVYEKKETKEMTLKEIEEQLGYKIKIKGE